MFEGWSAKECRRLALYAIFGYVAFWVVLALGVGVTIRWILEHTQWVP